MKNTQLCIAIFVALLWPLSALAIDNNTIKISAEDINNLGITLGKPTLVSEVPVLYAPAKVVIPPAGEYVVSASQAGSLTRLTAAVGDKVKKGEELAQLSSPDLLSMQQLYLKANSDLQLQQLAYDRDKKLFEEGVVAKRRWLETSSLYHASAYAASEHRQLLAMSGMSEVEIEQLAKTHRLLGLAHIRAPITGVVVERMAVAGRVDRLAPLYRIADLHELWLDINIPQERIGQVKLGDKVLLEKPATESQNLEQRKEAATIPVSAEISLLSQNVNPENQTILARAVIKGEHKDVRPGQRINIQIIQTHSSPAFSVPNTAVAQHQGKSYLFVRGSDGFIARLVTIIGKQGDETTLSGELTGNEEIAIKGAVALKANWLGLGSEE